MGVEVFIKGSGGGGIAINPFIQSDGTLYTVDSDAYLETLPFRSDAVGIAGNRGIYLTDLDNPNLSHHSNLFKHSSDPNFWYGDFGYGDFGVGYTIEDRHLIYGPTKDYGSLLAAQEFPEIAHYSAIFSPLGEQFFPLYYEDARYVYGETGGSDDYIWSEQDVPGFNIDGGWYKACYGRYNTNINPAGDTYSADILASSTFARFRLINDESNSGGFNNHRAELQFTPNRVTLERNNTNGGFDAWELRDRGPQVSQLSDRPAYYQNNPSEFNIGRELDHIPNVQYVNYTKTPITIQTALPNKMIWNGIYADGTSGTGYTSRQGTYRKHNTYDAIFYVRPNGFNSGYTQAERKNNKALAFTSIVTAWQQADQWEFATGERTLVWVEPGVYTGGTTRFYRPDLYFEFKAIWRANRFGFPSVSDFTNAPDNGVTIMGRGTFYNYYSVSLQGAEMSRECFLGNLRGMTQNVAIECDFIDNIWMGGFGGYREIEVIAKEFYGRKVVWQGAGGGNGHYRFKNTTFPNGIKSGTYRQNGVDITFEFKDCILSTPYNVSENSAGTAYDILDINNNIVDSYGNSDTFDTAALGHTSSQDVVNTAVKNGDADAVGIRACFEYLASNNNNFIAGQRFSRYHFINCDFLINKPFTLAMIATQSTNWIYFASGYQSKNGGIYIDGGIVNNWSGDNNSSAFFIVSNPNWDQMPYSENIARWTGENSGAPKYIDKFTVVNPAYGDTYVPVPNQAARQGKMIEQGNSVTDLIDFTPVTDNVWSTVTVDPKYAHGKVGLSIRCNAANADFFVREIGNANADIKGGTFYSNSTLGFLDVKVDKNSQFQVLTTNKTRIEAHILNVTSNRF
jgi:hypothetical protein